MLNSQEEDFLKKNGYLIPSFKIDVNQLSNLENIFEKLKSELENLSNWAYLGIFRKSNEYLRTITQTPILTTARQLLGEKVDLYWDSVVVKPANTGKEFFWHQDSGYGETSPLEYFTFWIPFQSTNSQNGGLWVMPGSHKQGILKHVKAPSSESNYPGLKIENFNSSDEISINLSAGQILIFSSLLAHRSGRNSTDKVRLALAFGIHKRGYSEYKIPTGIDPVPGLPLNSV